MQDEGYAAYGAYGAYGAYEAMTMTHINRMILKNKLHVVCIVWTTMYYEL